MATLVTDDFNRANSADLGATWNTQTGESALSITSNAITSTNDSTDRSENNSAVTWPNDQYAQVKVTSTGTWSFTDAGGGAAVRMATAARSYYRCTINNGNNLSVDKFVSGTHTNLAARSITYSAAQVVYIEVQGTTIQPKYAGANVGASISDSSVTSGRAGITFSGDTGGNDSITMDDWEGGDFSGAAATSQPPLSPSYVLGPLLGR